MRCIKMSLTNIKYPLGIFFLWRAVLIIVGYLSLHLLPFKASFPYINSTLQTSHLPQWLWQWGNFDGVYYLRIAQKGYEAGEQAFFPLYPLIINLLTALTRNYLLSALLISNFLAAVSGILLYQLVRKHFSISAARWSVLILYFFPTAFFLGAAYSEPMLLVLVLSAFLSSGMTSAVFSALAGTTKLVGVLLAPAAVFPPRKIFLTGALVGLGIYMTFLASAYQNPFAFLSAQSYFGNSRAATIWTLVSPVQVAYRYVHILLTVDPRLYSYRLAILEVSSFLFGLTILTLITVKRKFSSSWVIFSWLSFLLPTLTGTFQSLPRYLLPIFPIYLYLAQIKQVSVKIFLLTIFGLLQFLLTIFFLRGYFVA